MIEQISGIVESYPTLFRITAIVICTVVIARIVNALYKKFVARSASAHDSHLTTYKFLEHSITVMFYLTGFSFAISNIEFLRPVVRSMLAGAGILAIAIGFAAQQALGNIISGIFIVISKPYLINDRISFKDGLGGVVEDISLRHTVIRNFENQRIIIPNSIISNEVLVNSNFSDTRICKLIDVGISYSSDIDLAKKIMFEEISNHPLNLDIRTEEDIEKGTPRITVRVISLNDSSVTLRAWAWASDSSNSFVLHCDVLESIKKRFDREGIVIPFPQRSISYLPSDPNDIKQDALKDRS